MDSTLNLFLIGLAIGITTSLVVTYSEDNEFFIKTLVDEGFLLWHIAYLVIMLTVIPFLAIDSLKKRFTRKTFLPFPFLAGNGMGFLFLALIGTIISLIP